LWQSEQQPKKNWIMVMCMVQVVITTNLALNVTASLVKDWQFQHIIKSLAIKGL
jgi:hypothetical protein